MWCTLRRRSLLMRDSPGRVPEADRDRRRAAGDDRLCIGPDRRPRRVDRPGPDHGGAGGRCSERAVARIETARNAPISCRSYGRVSQSDTVRVRSETWDARFAENLPPETNFLTHERPGGASFGDSSCRLEVLRFLRSSMSSGHSRSQIVKVQSRSAGASSALSSRCCSCMRTSWSRQLA